MSDPASITTAAELAFTGVAGLVVIMLGYFTIIHIIRGISIGAYPEKPGNDDDAIIGPQKWRD